MSRTIGASLQTHIESDTTTLALCWKLTLTDATVIGFTSHVDDLEISGVTYEASTGLTPDAIESKLGTGIDNLDVMGILSSANITESDIHAGVYDYAEVEIFMVNYADVGMGIIMLTKGRIGDVNSSGGQFKAEVRSLLQNTSQRIVPLISVNCRVKKFGDAECGFSLVSPYKLTGKTVLTVSSNKQFTANFGLVLGLVTGLYNWGLVTWLTGDNAGRKMEIKTHTHSLTDTMILQQSMRNAIQVGDTFDIQSGCDRRLETCKAYSNIANFRGEPHVPGTDYLLQGPRP